VEVFVGGAVVNRKMADEFGARFAPDGIEMVKLLNSGA
jgi:hypothetical protein